MKSPQNKVTALFPGSFKPPHRSHIFAVRYLLQRSDIDRVVIIIANRSRLVPDTNLALDAEASRGLFERQLRDSGCTMSRIRIEIAKHRAVQHALEYFQTAETHEKLLFCIGASDHDSGDDRFRKIDELSRASGIAAELLVLPRPPWNTRATLLRVALGKGESGRSSFIDGLPDSLTAIQNERIWRSTKAALQPIAKIAERKICDALAEHHRFTPGDLSVIDAAATDPKFVLTGKKDRRLLVKYAGETAVDGDFFDPCLPKPPRRLAVERRVIKHLSRQLGGEFDLPKIEYFDKKRRLLITDCCDSECTSLASTLWSGDFSVSSAVLIGRFLARLHTIPVPKEAFWGDLDLETAHWGKLVRYLLELGARHITSEYHKDWGASILGQSIAAPDRLVLHLRFDPNAVGIRRERLRVSDFERSGSVGDSAYDLGRALAAYSLAALVLRNSTAYGAAVSAFFDSYVENGRTIGRFGFQRIMCFTAYALIEVYEDYALGRYDTPKIASKPATEESVVALANDLLSESMRPNTDGNISSTLAERLRAQMHD